MSRLLMALLVAGAVLCSVGTLDFSSTAAATSPMVGGGVTPWPPVRPSAILNLSESALLQPGEERVLYQVPPRQSLILTQASAALGSSPDGELLERLSGSDVVKLVSLETLETVDGIGIAFRPGSTLVYRNRGATPQVMNVLLFGYHSSPNAWPPIPADDLRSSSGNLNLAAGQAVKLLDVPQDRWLVLSTVETSGARTILLEDFNGVQTVKARPFQSPTLVGMTFRPGSSVLLKNGDTTTRNYRWLIVGWQEKDRR